VADSGRQDRTASKIQRAHERDSSKSRSIGGTRKQATPSSSGTAPCPPGRP